MRTPWAFQLEAIHAIFDYFYDGNRGNPLVVAPGGSGKSVIIAEFCRQVLKQWPSQRILIICHTKEIIAQNFKAICIQLPDPVGLLGIYSAGLKQKSIAAITVAGIQSIYDKPDLFQLFDIIIVDEAHTIPPKSGMYQSFFSKVQRQVIGLTATPFRLGQGYLHTGKHAFFDEIVYDIKFQHLQKIGRLCKLTTKETPYTFDASGIPKQAGDFVLKELSNAFDRIEITRKIIKDLLQYKMLRKKWLIFAIDIEHANHISDGLNEQGIYSIAVHSKMIEDRDVVIQMFDSDHHYQALVSVGMLTTGFDCPRIDLVALLRSTASLNLHVQMPCRGTRIFPGKEDCLIRDYAGNFKRNGPIDNPRVLEPGQRTGKGDPIMKSCPKCQELVPAATKYCICCNHEFAFMHHLTEYASSLSAVAKEEWRVVDEVSYDYCVGRKGIPMIKVSYLCGYDVFKEYVCIEHGGQATRKAATWWKRRGGGTLPEKASSAVKLASQLNTPVKILIDYSGKFNNIIKQNLKETT